MRNITIDESLVDKNILAYKIENDFGKVIVILNLRRVSISENISFTEGEEIYKNIFTQQEVRVGNNFLFETAAGGYCILEKL